MPFSVIKQKEYQAECQKTWSEFPALLLTGCLIRGESSHCSEPQFSHLENVGAGSGEYNSMATNVRYCRILCAKRVTKQIIKYSRIIENSISLKPLLPMGSEVDRRAQTLGILCIQLITIYPQNIPSLTFKKGQNSQELNRNVNVL